MPRTIGLAQTSSTNEVPVYDQTYNEQTVNGQRSLKSASANDSAAGTGARQVKVTYFAIDSAGKVTGPFSEIVVMNGVTAVPLVATNLAFVERMDAVVVGSTGASVGAITLFANNDGTGTAIAILAAQNTQTFLGHHYVASGARCRITDAQVQGGDAAAALFAIKRQAIPIANMPETVQNGPLTSSASTFLSTPFADSVHVVIPGPCRLRITVKPANNNAQLSIASFGFVDQGNIMQGV